jgi:hypothetical protein
LDVVFWKQAGKEALYEILGGMHIAASPPSRLKRMTSSRWTSWSPCGAGLKIDQPRNPDGRIDPGATSRVIGHKGVGIAILAMSVFVTFGIDAMEEKHKTEQKPREPFSTLSLFAYLALFLVNLFKGKPNRLNLALEFRADRRFFVTMQEDSEQRRGKVEPSLNRSIRIGAGLVTAVAVGALLVVLFIEQKPKLVEEAGPSPEPTAQHDITPPPPPTESPQPLSQAPAANSTSSIRSSTPAAVPQPVAQPVRPEPTPETRQLVNSLVKLQPQNGVLSEEFAKGWKQNLQQLVQQGPAGIPAIQEFLANNLDYAFGEPGRQMLGYSSARGAMFDALTQIGGPQAVSAMTGVLQSTADPREIALLAQDLEKLDPGQHQQDVVNAAEQALAMASTQKQGSADAAPLFEVLQKYGGAAVVAELENVTRQWGYYGPISLAQLPDGAGIPSLVQMANDPKVTVATRDAAYLSLAQVFDQSQEARSTLVEQAKANGFSEFAWRIMAPVLAGDRVEFLDSAFDNRQGAPQVAGVRSTSTSDNQRFFSVPVELSPTQINQRMGLIDEMLAATTDPIGLQVLQQSRSSLANRLEPPGAIPGQ